MVVSAEGSAQSHAEIPQGAPQVPREVMPKIANRVHGLKKTPNLMGLSFARSSNAALLQKFIMTNQLLGAFFECD
jgi:hypothetical protein